MWLDNRGLQVAADAINEIGANLLQVYIGSQVPLILRRVLTDKTTLVNSVRKPGFRSDSFCTFMANKLIYNCSDPIM